MVDREAQLTVFADVYSAVSDPDGGNNQSFLDYLLGPAGRVFADGFEE